MLAIGVSMPIAVSLAVSLLLVATTVLLHYELLQFAAGLPAPG